MTEKTRSVVGAIHELPLRRWSIYHQWMINKNLKRRIYVDPQHDYFVQCVSHILVSKLLREKNLPDKAIYV